MATEEEIQKFVSENKELIESIMRLQREGVVEATSAARDATKEAVVFAHDSADAARARAEDFGRAAYSMFMDPEVQRHFMTMGMEFMLGLSAMMQKAPIPDFVKETAGNTEKNFKSAACRANEDCGARKVQKVNINVEGPSDGPQEIKVGDGE